MSFVLLASLSLLATGCAMCADCFDYDYGAYGGACPRTDMSYGRVGSAFTGDQACGRLVSAEASIPYTEASGDGSSTDSGEAGSGSDVGSDSGRGTGSDEDSSVLDRIPDDIFSDELNGDTAPRTNPQLENSTTR